MNKKTRVNKKMLRDVERFEMIRRQQAWKRQKNGLKPCPFCGSSVVVWETAYGVVKVVECKTCSIRFVFPWSKTETGKDLADKWNRRQQDDTEQKSR